MASFALSGKMTGGTKAISYEYEKCHTLLFSQLNLVFSFALLLVRALAPNSGRVNKRRVWIQRTTPFFGR